MTIEAKVYTNGQVCVLTRLDFVAKRRLEVSQRLASGIRQKTLFLRTNKDPNVEVSTVVPLDNRLEFGMYLAQRSLTEDARRMGVKREAEDILSRYPYEGK